MVQGNQIEIQLVEAIPHQMNESDVLYFMHNKRIDFRYVNAIKSLTKFNDDIISEWLNVSVKTFREYRKPESVFKDNTKEHVLVLLALIKHGIEVFGSVKAFEEWLNTQNFYFNNEKPEAFLNTVTGVRYTDERLTAMEYGDNV